MIEQGRDDEAHAVVLRLHSKSGSDTSAAEKEYAEMHDAIKAEMHVRSRHISDLWRSPAMIRRTFVAMGVQIFGQFTGINGEFAPYLSCERSMRANTPSLVINYFGPEMYQTLGLGKGSVLLVQGIYGAVGPIANFL